jgi:uncharacterized protein (TIGR02145 family)
MKTTLFLLLLTIFAFNCKKDNAKPALVSNITIKTAPTKADYFNGDALNLSGLVVTLQFDNGSSADVSFSDFEDKGITTSITNGTVLTAPVYVNITHTASEKSTNQAITVNDIKVTDIAIKTNPQKVSYFTGDALDLTGLVVTLTRSNATKEDIPFSDFDSKGITTSPANGTALANSNTTITITHTYSLKSTNQAISVTEPNTVTDIDGNVYHTVTIGTQVWMVENLKTTKYRDGTSIPNVTNDDDWAILTTGAYCDYDNTPTNSTTYGKLYNWYAATNAHNIAPTGWHVPTDEEWNTLTTYLGGESVAGGMLKEIGTTHWASPNTGATNETGFTALPGGSRYGSGGFYDIGNDGSWWSTTDHDGTLAWYRYIIYNEKYVISYNFRSKVMGFSVRCVKD